MITATGIDWLGRLEGDASYDALITRAGICHSGGTVLPVLADLVAKKFCRFA